MPDGTREEMLDSAERWLAKAAAALNGIDQLHAPSNERVAADSAYAAACAAVGHGLAALAESTSPMTVVQNFAGSPLTPEEAENIRKRFEQAVGT